MLQKGPAYKMLSVHGHMVMVTWSWSHGHMARITSDTRVSLQPCHSIIKINMKQSFARDINNCQISSGNINMLDLII